MVASFSKPVVFLLLFLCTNLCPSLCCVTARELGRLSVCAGHQWPHPGPASRWSPRWWRTRTATGLCETDGTRCGWGWYPFPERREKSRQADCRLLHFRKPGPPAADMQQCAWCTTRGRYSAKYCGLSCSQCPVKRSRLALKSNTLDFHNYNHPKANSQKSFIFIIFYCF